MGKFDGVLLVSDFDDTLYDLTYHIPERNIRALEYFVGEGGLFTVATGRARRTFAPQFHRAPINAPVILSNGAGIYDFKAGQALEETFLLEGAARDLSQVAEAFPNLAMEAYFEEGIYVWNPNEITRAHLKKVGCDYVLCHPGQVPEPWEKAILHQEREVLLQVRDYMMDRWSDRYDAIFSNHYYLEVTRKGSTKGGMVSKLAEYLHIRPENVYCVGDNQNDLSMLKVSAIPFAPANCAEEVRAWGATVLCHCNEGVVADVVELLDKRYSK